MPLTRRLLLSAIVLFSACEPVPKVVESGFMMADDSFAFANFAYGEPQAYVDPPSMIRLFGDGVCTGGNTEPCILTPMAQAWMSNANTLMNGGRCEGFAVSSTLFFTGDLKAADFGADNVRKLKIADSPELQRELAYWFSSQLANETVTKQTEVHFAKDVLPFLAKVLAKDSTERYRLGIAKKSGSALVGGHSLTMIGYYEDSKEAGVYWLRVYDSNNPDTERAVRIDTKKNEWSYEAARNPKERSSLYVGNDANQNPMFFSPVRSRLGVKACPFCTENSGAQVLTQGGVQAIADDGSGAAGLRDGQLVSTSSSSAGFTFSGLDEDAPAVVINTKAATRLDVSLAPSGEDLGAVSSIGPGFAVTLDGLALKTGTDTLQLRASGSDVTFNNGSRTSFGLTSALPRSTGSIQVTTRIEGGSNSVKQNIDPASGELTLTTAGAMGSTVTVIVSATDLTGAQKSGQLTFNGGDAQTLTVAGNALETGAALQGSLVTDGDTSTVSDSCANGTKDGTESDIDCGGTCATKCPLAAACTATTDCASGFCHATANVCVESACVDGQQNAGETDVDCGGACNGCADGKPCTQNSDCSSGVCGGTTCSTSFSIGVAVSGLRGTPIVLSNNGTDTISPSTDGSYAFPTRIVGAYEVTIEQQPANATCVLSDETGIASASSLVTVTCTPKLSVGGTLSGLPAGQSVTLHSSTGEDLALDEDGAYVFSQLFGGSYEVTIATQPAEGTCTIANSSASISADVTDVDVTCTSNFSIAGTVSGLPATETVTLLNNGIDPTLVSANTGFTFPERVVDYDVTVGTQPTNARCAVANGSGTASADVSNVAVTCMGTVTIGGSVTGLPSGDSFDVHDSASGTNAHVTGNTTFTMPTPLLDYQLSIINLTSASGASCIVQNGTGTSALGAVTNVQVLCGYAVSGNISGYGNTHPADPNYLFSLQLNGTETVTPAVGASTYNFATPVSSYSIAVTQQPLDGWCTVSATTGTASAPVNVDVNCAQSGTRERYLAGSAPFENEFKAVALGLNGSSILVGRNQLSATDDSWHLQKLTAAGASDTTFADTGTLDFNPGDGLGEFATAVAPNSTGGFVIGGRFTGDAGFDIGLVSVNAAGDVLATVTDDLAGSDETVAGVIALPSGSFIVAGSTSAGATSDLFIAKYTSAGVRDATFGTNGVTFFGGVGTEHAAALVQDSNGKFIVVGSAGNASLVVRFDGTGAFETSFNPDLSLAGRANALTSVAALANGQLLIGGWQTAADSTQDFAVARLNTTGALDTTFGTNGVFTQSFGAAAAQVRAVGFNARGRLYLAGISGNDGVIGALTSSGATDVDFATTGFAVDNQYGVTTYNGLAVDAFGHVQLAGSLGDVTSSDFSFIWFFQ